MKVPLLDLKAQYAAIRGEIKEAVEGVLESQYFILGPEVEALEGEVARYVGADFAVGVASGSDAILVALMALKIGSMSGGEATDAVVTTPYSFFATAGSITRVGAVPIFIDIDPATFNIDPEKLKSFLSGLKSSGDSLKTKDGLKIKAIMPVHLYGQTADMDPILELAVKYGLSVVEDAAQAIGSKYKGRGAGSMGDFGCFSFFPSKNLGGYGDGGMLTTNNADLAERARILRNHGSKPKYYHKIVGLNSRLDALQGAILRVKLKHLDKWSEGRRKNADIYRELITSSGIAAGKNPVVTLPVEVDGYHHIYNQFVITVEDRDGLRACLADNGIGTEIYYPLPLHIQECYKDLGYSKGDFPESERGALTSLALPVYPELTRKMIDYVVDTIAEFYK
ncbi:MAG: DegT/DnrJ/EryC1/StrS family aminotransferase [Deltaproteobacteria bacterium]|uniref:DegT/DnrJ/EryC1/StrS family aminotransferase n=1 Tax=Candidatus Zymogenus saltonus TaxID=2844893 RepID=A0A9D8KFN1_9DELT|nr:DegT/DnrJ/EryC1/StrS family aminotransferase [Candidatus Zymogenus saltonus]